MNIPRVYTIALSWRGRERANHCVFAARTAAKGSILWVLGFEVMRGLVLVLLLVTEDVDTDEEKR
jgi:hypothetical protein